MQKHSKDKGRKAKEDRPAGEYPQALRDHDPIQDLRRGACSLGLAEACAPNGSYLHPAVARLAVNLLNGERLQSVRPGGTLERLPEDLPVGHRVIVILARPRVSRQVEHLRRPKLLPIRLGPRNLRHSSRTSWQGPVVQTIDEERGRSHLRKRNVESNWTERDPTRRESAWH